MLAYILLLSPVYIALFWAIILNTGKKRGSNPKRLLGKFMIAAFIIYLSHFNYFLKFYNVYIYLDSIYLLSSLLVFPLYYIYVRLLTVDESFEFRKHIYYLIPPFIVFLVSATGYMFASAESRVEYIMIVLPGTLPARDGTWLMNLAKSMFDILSPLQFIVYTLLAIIHIRRHNRELGNFYSDARERKLGWVEVFIIILLITSGTGLVLSILGRSAFANDPVKLIGPAITVSVLLFLIGYIGNIQLPAIVNYDKEDVDDDKIPDKLRDDLLRLFEKEKYYLKKDFRIWDISDNLGTNRTYVSRLINNEFGVNFTTFVNNYRVRYAKELLNNNKHHSIEEIAEMAGFGSPNSLYRAFETSEGISLPEYRQQIKGKK